MWTYHNPVRVQFGPQAFDGLAGAICGRRYAVVTYSDAFFHGLTESLARNAGKPVIVIDDVAPNPDFKLLRTQCERFATLREQPEVIVALGGGSVIDSAKVFSAAGGNFEKVRTFLETKQGADDLSSTPIVAVPTTAGTGSEVTCWATVWDADRGQKYSLARPDLYPEAAIVDPVLMLGKPHGLTLPTALDALSHALESIWNVNANPVSARHAVAASKIILATLPNLLVDLGNLELRTELAQASLLAGLAFSNTKTAIAHNISYPITLGWGVQHGIACSFTLPTVLRSVIGTGGFREASLKEIFGPDLERGAKDLEAFLINLGIGTQFSDHGVPSDRWPGIVDQAFAGERGRNFIGNKERFLAAAAGA
jgi:alcohol dehydrogenase